MNNYLRTSFDYEKAILSKTANLDDLRSFIAQLTQRPRLRDGMSNVIMQTSDFRTKCLRNEFKMISNSNYR
jgi:hypothetical protein